ncbi:MAG: hypothetical protein AAF628_35475 [Planctomycetota bacterium]
MVIRQLALLLAVASSLGSSFVQAQEVEISTLRCVVTGKPAKEECVAAFNFGKVYLCSDDCVEAVEQDAKRRSRGEYVARANHQLVLTKQYEVKGCYCGKPDPLQQGRVSDVDGVDVGFCCESCQAAVDAQTDVQGKLDLVFAYLPFKKAYRKTTSPYFRKGIKCFMMPKKNVRNRYTIEHHEGTVFLCCANCIKKYRKDVAKHSPQCNHQLVLTGQFEQIKCPITGGEIDPSIEVEVVGVKVRLADPAAREQLEAAGDDESKIALVFEDGRFLRAFAKRPSVNAPTDVDDAGSAPR